MPTPGPLEIVIILVIVLVIFGPKRLPDLGKSLGRGMREFKDSVTGKDKEREEIEAAQMAAAEKPEPAQMAAAEKPEPAASTSAASTSPREQGS